MTTTRHICGRCHNDVTTDDYKGNPRLPAGWVGVAIIATPTEHLILCAGCIQKLRALLHDGGGVRGALMENA